MGEFTCLVGLNRARIFLEFGWPQWGKSMSERAEKAEALAARIKPILAGNDPDIKGKRRQLISSCPPTIEPVPTWAMPRRRWAKGIGRPAQGGAGRCASTNPIGLTRFGLSIPAAYLSPPFALNAART